MEDTTQAQDKNLEVSLAQDKSLEVSLAPDKSLEISQELDQRYMLVEDSILLNILDQPLETFLGSALLIIWVLDISSAQLAILEHVKLLGIL